jgi:NAD(P)-dependent dehydrogenase (short-subunit alcohol dehydrogenase family)
MALGLEGRRALVTGAARGIGAATAERLAAEGVQVAAVDIEPADGPLAIRADVSDEAAVEAAVAQAVEALGGLDIIVANAATQLVGRDARAHQLDLETWRETIETNLTGAFLTAKHGIRALLASGGGAVVCVGSPAGHFGIAPGLDAYSASKAGIFGLVRVMAADYAREGIRVNGVFPGITDTPMNDWWRNDPEQRAQAEASVPLGRVGSAEEIAAVIAFLCSDDASYVTGAVWAVDGGLTAV